MKIVAVINKDGGSVSELDLDVFCNHLKTEYGKSDHTLEIKLVEASQLVETLENVAGSQDAEGLIACGGDGTASLTASLCYKHGKVFGLLPGGTMNLYARTLGIPLDLYEAGSALATAGIMDCDIASANGRHFIHQFSLGIQPKIIEQRDQLEHLNSTTKMLSGVTSIVSVVTDEPETYSVVIDAENNTEYQDVSVLTVTNNPYGKNHLPYADQPDKGTLGVYWTDPLSRYDLTMLITDIIAGNWNENPSLKHTKCEKMKLRIKKPDDDAVVSIDGELVELEETVEFEIHKAAVRVFVPDAAV